MHSSTKGDHLLSAEEFTVIWMSASMSSSVRTHITLQVIAELDTDPVYSFNVPQTNTGTAASCARSENAISAGIDLSYTLCTKSRLATNQVRTAPCTDLVQQ